MQHGTVKLSIGVYLSAARAARVNTDTPIEISLTYSDSLQIDRPHGHVSSV